MRWKAAAARQPVDFLATSLSLSFGLLAVNRLPVSCQSVNRLISVNYSFRHVGTIRLTLAPHPPGNLVSLARNQYPTCT
jgi:hypothetical protein